jgi:hypothetical protein
MRGLLLLSVVGAVLYGVLLVTANDVPNREAEIVSVRSTQLDRPGERTLRSWGPNLPGLAIKRPSHNRPDLAERPDGKDPLVGSRDRSADEVGMAKQEQMEAANAMGSPAEDEISKPTPAGPAVRPTQRSQSAKAAPQVAEEFVSKSKLRRGRWARRDERRRRFGLFGRRFATSEATR